MFNRIFAWLFSLLVCIIPWFKNFSPALDWRAETAVVLSAIQKRDIETIESYMCKNIKDNVPNLRSEIGKLIDAIQGNIISCSELSASGSGWSTSSGGKTIEQTDSGTLIKTANREYVLLITWETYNNFNFEERGIRYISIRIRGEEDMLAEISATEGIWSMHS